jgi:ubiquinone/menaquinone biosynthesis C-methylase UbiE
MTNNLTKKSYGINKLYNSDKFNDKIFKLINKILVKNNIPKSTIINIISKKNTDEKISIELAKLIKNPENLYSESEDFRRAYYKWTIIKKNTTKNISNILDFGGNVGNTAYFIGQKMLKLNKKNIIVADIDEWGVEKWSPRKDITFINSSKLNTISNNSIDMISAFHVLHHINSKEYEYLFNEFYRILSPDGFIVIYEHDCDNNDMSILIDLEHALYDIVASQKITWNNFIKSFYAKYMSKNMWKKMFENAGFKLYKSIELNNLDNSFYMFFKK